MIKVEFHPSCGRGLQWPGRHHLSFDHCGGWRVYPSIHIRSVNKDVDGLAILDITPSQLILLAWGLFVFAAKRQARLRKDRFKSWSTQSFKGKV